MFLPSLKRLFKTDYAADQQSLIEKLAETINQNFEVLYELGNKKTSLRDNILCSVRDVDISVDANGKPLSTTSIGLDGPGKVDGVTVINCFNNNNTSLFPTAQPFIAFTAQSSSIIITNVKGLTPGTSWKLRVIVWQA